MTSSVIVIHAGGNKSLDVVLEQWVAEKKPVESGDVSTAAGWSEVSRETLYNPGKISREYTIYDTQRIRVEEVGEFLEYQLVKKPVEPKVD